MNDASDLRALSLNCSLKADRRVSHTWALMEHSIAVLRSLGVEVDTVHALEHHIAFGMSPDTGSRTRARR